MKPIYKICKKFWEPSQNLRSHDSKSLNSKYYDQKSHKKIKPKILENTDYDRVVKSSDRGTLGENNISNKNISNNTFSKTLNKTFNNNFNGASNIFNDSFSQTLGNDDYERIVKSSDRGTLGGNNTFNNNTFNDNPNNTYNSNFNGTSDIFKNSVSQTLGDDDYERVVKSSERGTLCGDKGYNCNNDINPFKYFHNSERGVKSNTGKEGYGIPDKNSNKLDELRVGKYNSSRQKCTSNSENSNNMSI